MVWLNWNTMNKMAREALLIQAGLQLHLANEEWSQLGELVQYLIGTTCEEKSHNTVGVTK